MRLLLEKFEELENLLLHHRRTLDQNTGVPFLRLVYRPEEEPECQRLCESLAQTLKLKRVPVETVSCRGVIFAHYERAGRIDQLFEMEPTEGERLNKHIAKFARRELVNRLSKVSKQLGNDGVIFLTETAFTFPYLSLSPVLEDCTNHILPPKVLVIFYPGKVSVDKRLMFLGLRPAGYYRTRDLI